MKVKFLIEYNTVFGEQLVLNIVDRDEKGGEKTTSYPMSTADGRLWTLALSNLDGTPSTPITYYYSLTMNGRVSRKEWTVMPHRLKFNVAKGNGYEVHDRWNSQPEDAYLYSSAFTDCVNRRSVESTKTSRFAKTLRLKVRAPQLRCGERLAITGSDGSLGEWHPEKALSMTEFNCNEWLVDLNAEVLGQAVEFKFIAVGGKEAVWETGANRHLQIPFLTDGQVLVVELDQAFFPFCNARFAGTLVPVFSLRSESSFGVGDFGDLKKMVDWVAQTGQRVLQVLPINDTTTTHTWTDSYPYSCISIFALHPQYADLNQLPPLADKEKAAGFEALRQELNALGQIDYERVNDGKTAYLRELYAQEGKNVLASAEYHKFFKETEHWLVPYAQYCLLRDKYGTADFSRWPDHNSWNEKDRTPLSNARSKAFKEVAFYYFVQFILNKQMHAAHEYARSKGVILKGDIPIGVNRYGCDVWQEPEYFNMNGQAGAPPDDFSANGQNWGFPTYNWDAMLADGCKWWVRRFQNMSKFFDAYRIDHVLGFFRIWEIPLCSVHALLGQFAPALGMTPAEIESYGLHFQEELFTKPFIADWTVDTIFGGQAPEVKAKYLDHAHDDIYNLKPEYDTQRKIEAAFAGKDAPQDIAIRDGLYALVSDVLFVRDRKDGGKFHPRISAQFGFMYRALYDNDKAAFNRLYNDYYYRRNNQFWYEEAMKKLPLLVQATRMLVCAEDLGMVPDCVQWVMKELRILSLELQSMPKDPTVKFGHLENNPYRSVCTISSHDMPTLRQWWDEDMARTQEYYNTMLQKGGAAIHPLPGWLASEIVGRQLESPSMLCILSIQDWMAMDERLRLPDANAERINIPANPKHYWRYRMHLNIEQLMRENDFNTTIKELISQKGRQ